MPGEVIFPNPDTLDQLYDGSLNLGAPLYRGIIQVYATAIDGFTRLLLEKSGAGILVVREDDAPIQVQVRHTILDFDDPCEVPSEPVMVFQEPTPLVKITRYSRDPGSWRMGANMPACDRRAAAVFLSVLGEYALQKQ